MKIIFAIGSLTGGGAERVVTRLANQMCQMGHQIHILMIANGNIKYPLDEKVAASEICNTNNIRGLRYLSRCREFKKQVLSYRPDVVVSFTTVVNIFVLQALKGTKTKIVLSERNDPYSDPTNPILRNIRDRVYSKADGFVFQTPDAQNYFATGIQHKSTVIFNPLDNSIPGPWTGEREKRIVSVGRLEKQKNHKLLLNAFAAIAEQFPEFILEIYGEGSLRPILEKQIVECRLEKRVFLKGYTPQVLMKIRQAALFVLPSDYEGLSNALIEAMAIGIPVISTDHPTGGARMIIQPGVNGVLIPVGDTYSMAKAMEFVLTDNLYSEKISKEACKISNLISAEKIATQWAAFLQKIVFGKI